MDTVFTLTHAAARLKGVSQDPRWPADMRAAVRRQVLSGSSAKPGKSRVWLAADGCVSSTLAVGGEQLVCQSGRSGLSCSQSTKVASSQ
jgi:hypothetical protein